MKNYFFIALAVVFLAACGGDETQTATANTNDITKDPNYQKGLQLEAANDCKTCHAIDTKITGPPFRDIADKYSGYPDTIVPHLARKVRSGGSGVWGDIPMLPHPNLSQQDAETIVHYVLLLKTKK